MKTVMANAKTVERQWWVVDAANMPLGREIGRASCRERVSHQV